MRGSGTFGTVNGERLAALLAICLPGDEHNDAAVFTLVRLFPDMLIPLSAYLESVECPCYRWHVGNLIAWVGISKRDTIIMVDIVGCVNLYRTR